jgi:hypothetical protein
MRPGLGFRRRDEIAFLRPTLVLEENDRPGLMVVPRGEVRGMATGQV